MSRPSQTPLTQRSATAGDLPLLAEWNHQLIEDEGHRNRMTVGELEERMRGWLEGEYTATVFEHADQPAGYAVWSERVAEVYLRQFFIRRESRRQGIGRAAMRLLFDETWPRDKRLVVEVLCRNEPAVAFWRSVGYQDYCLTLEIVRRS
jgi:predicted acetyltransferase